MCATGTQTYESADKRQSRDESALRATAGAVIVDIRSEVQRAHDGAIVE
jgi:hypothetical protein